VIHKIDNVVGPGGFGGRLNANRLVQCNKDKILGVLRLYGLAVNFYKIAGGYLVSNLSPFAVDKDVTLLDISVCLAARADTALANILIEAFRVGRVNGAPPRFFTSGLNEWVFSPNSS